MCDVGGGNVVHIGAAAHRRMRRYRSSISRVRRDVARCRRVRSLVDVHLRLNIVSLHQPPATALARSRSTPLRASAVDTERVAQRTT